MIQIESVGLALAEHADLEPLPWRPEQTCWPAVGSELSGRKRWNALARKALLQCLGESSPSALIVASSNGGAQHLMAADWRESFCTESLLDGTPWEGQRHPVVSTSCTSGAHALFVADLALAQGLEDVMVLVVDILSPASIKNFASLRVLSSVQSLPWQGTAEGFVPGEGAVALRVRARGSSSGGEAIGVRATTWLGESDGFARLLADAKDTALQVLGQGSGPAAVDDEELRAIAQAVSSEAPLSAPSYSKGHTVGVSSILGISMLAGGMQVSVPTGVACDGRPIKSALPGVPTIALCRALTSQVTLLGSGIGKPTRPFWTDPQSAIPYSTPALRELVEHAARHRPAEVPDALHVHFEYPLLPPERCIIGGRLLPSAVLELSPGFAATQIARVWGYTGPATASVGTSDLRTSPAFAGLLAQALVVYVLGDGNRRRIIWPGNSLG